MTPIARVRSFTELLASLPPPRKGLHRVFRGQTKRYFLESAEPAVDSLLPAMMRKLGPFSVDPVWHSAAILMAKSFQRQAKHLRATRTAHLVIASALMQHYGAACAFLDVTKSLPVALWFATHELKSYDDNYRSTSGPSGPWVGFTAHWFEALKEAKEGAVLYVFDVARWDGMGPIEPGHLVDVRDHWYGFNGISPEASRILVQHAALLGGFDGGFATELRSAGIVTGRVDTITSPLAQSARDECNLYPYLTAILTLDLPFQAPAEVELERDTRMLFPPPDVDPVYRRLLSVPLCIDTSERARQNLQRGTKLRRPFEIPEYHCCPPPNIDPAHVLARDYGKESICFAENDRSPNPLLFFLWALEHPEQGAAVKVDGQLVELSSALPILLECALFYDLPAAHPDREGHWNHAKLAARLPDLLEGMRLDNIFLEFSALDMWPLDQSQSTSDRCLRAVWTVRNGDHYTVSIFSTHVVDRKVQDLRITTNIRFDSQTQQFQPELVLPNPGSWTERVWRKFLGKPLGNFGLQERLGVVEPMQGLFLTLKVLHDLAPTVGDDMHIPVESGPDIRIHHKRAPVVLRRGEGPYYVLKTRAGKAYSPRMSEYLGAQVVESND